MADYSMVMSQAELSSLKETLCAQQQLLQKLYNELDAEREASATAASEALSVILRLQGEKSAVKMEAEQYKRLSEEKMCHAEESLAIIEDIIYQKELEVATLDYQVESYRYKLLSMGCVDPAVGDEIKFPENLLQKNETLAGDTSLHSLGRRNSAPHLLKYKKCVNERESSTSPETDLSARIVEERMGQEINDKASESDKKTDNSTSGGINSYWEQIKKLDERVKEIAGANYAYSKNEIRSPSSISSRLSTGNLYDSSSMQNGTRSPSPQLSIGNAYDKNKVAIVNEIDLIKKNGVAVDNSCPPNVYDVFEVPQVEQNLRSCESSTKVKRKTVRQGSESLESEDSVPMKLYAKDEPDWLKKLLQSTHRENYLCKPSEIAAIDCHLAIVRQSTSDSESRPRSNQLHRTSEIIEVERPAESTNREEELKLLNEIREKLDSLHYEIRSLKTMKTPMRDEPSLLPLAEAMIYFWL